MLAAQRKGPLLLLLRRCRAPLLGRCCCWAAGGQLLGAAAGPLPGAAAEPLVGRCWALWIDLLSVTVLIHM